MSATVASRPARASRGGAQQHRSSRPHDSLANSQAVATAPTPIAESDETRALRRKYGDKLATLKEMFPGWTDEDLLSTLNDVNGSLETAVGRISEGA